MEKNTAEQIMAKALAAVEELTAALAIAREQTSTDELAKLSKGIGLAIGAIEMHVNVPLYHRFPELEK
ncbi:hypothetical protein OU995_06045 [Roseateles sp. SL47]|uniref:hypothetical protein n=1 Tax=Roseateles sp. SL47 TaxID=2995138 RepID=UPI00226DC00E|nr:hypothetical protein [Roseateles sp. SL47]WAC74281.1 hypothetical protein OU995_06045 [Roseateles sp. SL47]